MSRVLTGPWTSGPSLMKARRSELSPRYLLSQSAASSPQSSARPGTAHRATSKRCAAEPGMGTRRGGMPGAANASGTAAPGSATVGSTRTKRGCARAVWTRSPTSLDMSRTAQRRSFTMPRPSKRTSETSTGLQPFTGWMKSLATRAGPRLRLCERQRSHAAEPAAAAARARAAGLAQPPPERPPPSGWALAPMTPAAAAVAATTVAGPAATSAGAIRNQGTRQWAKVQKRKKLA
mmetsp:Transcript_106644/g.331233  ORF Transcript_106644/g.331233 Transcript_106644/m.331233 type:complete len:235 (-) Transcript_106644:3-707(-)